MAVVIPDGLTPEDKVKFLFAEHAKLDPSTPEAQEVWDLISTSMMELKAAQG